MRGDTWGIFLTRLKLALDKLDRLEATKLCDELLDRLQQDEVPPLARASEILGALRRKRFHDLVERLADAFRSAQMEEPKIRRLYAQALIDQGKIEVAVDTLRLLSATTAATNPSEHAEAQGLLGRVDKQLYVNLVNENPAKAQSPVVRAHLTRAFEAYRSVFEANRSELWHGVNAVALASRAEADKVPLNAPFAWKEVATEIRQSIEARKAAGATLAAWDLATGLECQVALGDWNAAEPWLAAYVASTDADAFELNSTLRQLKEVWRLGEESGPPAMLLSVLEAHLASRQGGALTISPAELARRPHRLTGAQRGGFEATFGREGVENYQWFCLALERFRLVARICDPFRNSIGSGFLVKGAQLDPRLGDERVLVTNAHVVSDDPAVRKDYRQALVPAKVVVRFDAWQKQPQEFAAKEILWTSPPWQLDTTVLRLDPAPPAGDDAPFAEDLPDPAKGPRVYVIGYPKGGPLAISLNDNALLAHDGLHLHYRAPTEPGSSGSPVFNRDWELIGVHHRGDPNAARLDGAPGTYQANEGIALKEVLKALRSAPPPPRRSRSNRTGQHRPPARGPRSRRSPAS